ncbi:hypothetical protein [Burkholderia ubonensis]|uniref:hypothetical protein n=1 Tax=Burkholderia ubonensis TaxID=101571 RepID=UPI0007581AED|nr:hypothetical protein [Burkholderia ubonensis]KVP63776.1 hypothetical protein WJ90_23720 [Burkholderia ubonensis]KVR59142.1 hypothetical protein WK16_21090 [Burkholderia ubonensis]KVT76853.1 hypothetical protein WK58_11695 [Burkholderia ubonensis]KVW34996.1 hypothetical protein WK93_29605 [Burkholderia ubonensis]KVX08249.1 hypothetical protein WL01_26765 [Burkholderia ubonensis]
MRHGRRAGLTKETLLPLSTEKVRALSLENHMALAVVRSGNGDCDQVVCLLRVVYFAFFMRGETASGSDLDLYRRAEAVLDVCIGRAERRGAWTLREDELADVERVLVVHDEQLAAVPKHHYLAAWDRLQRFVTGRGQSPIPQVEIEM